ncbi:DNA topoisomerase family protein [Photobacterium atrarenae]|uniref:Topoisomerase DNA-binding C4 zinc finger domain-containing protein n=1 Tax=Photobacterium atrarenae TaxID=865757 RepID=A0ABY5GG81_9GAMM|nr:topoisomerase DNA-binding C4 zinc finger domain-containing protein [Photobacterium atrarenae]UTV27714.1 topoisomerase DNA-binding C4 zinc finger domain-containing protein [Photobacterium atrarenae]
MAGKIDEQLFSAREHALEQHCPRCGAELVMRNSKRGPFLGCSAYPACDFIQSLSHNDGHIVKRLGTPCPECGEELLLRQGRYGMFIGCAGYPACHHIESPERKAADTQLTCPDCGRGHLVERKSRYGKTFYACDQYPACRFAVNFKPVAGACQQCGFGLLIEKKLASGIKLQCAARKCHAYQA